MRPRHQQLLRPTPQRRAALRRKSKFQCNSSLPFTCFEDMRPGRRPRQRRPVPIPRQRSSAEIQANMSVNIISAENWQPKQQGFNRSCCDTTCSRHTTLTDSGCCSLPGCLRQKKHCSQARTKARSPSFVSCTSVSLRRWPWPGKKIVTERLQSRGFSKNIFAC